MTPKPLNKIQLSDGPQRPTETTEHRTHRALQNWAGGLALNAIVLLIVALGVRLGWLVIP